MNWQLTGDHVYLSEQGTFMENPPSVGDLVYVPFDIPEPKFFGDSMYTYKGIGRVRLNKCVMNYQVVPGHLTNGNLEQAICIKFRDFRTKKTIELYIKGMSRLDPDNGHQVVLQIYQEGYTAKKLKYKFNSCAYPTDGLAFDTDTNMDQDNYTSLWGLTEFQTKIYWVDDFKLDGTCYVFVFGHWGILLTDDLQVDAIVAIRDIDMDEIRLQDCIYTSNPYIAKLMLLRQEK